MSIPIYLLAASDTVNSVPLAEQMSTNFGDASLSLGAAARFGLSRGIPLLLFIVAMTLIVGYVGQWVKGYINNH